MDAHAGPLRRAFEERTATVAVVGLGYVGLPLALTFWRGGFRVVGYDVDRRKVEQLAAGSSYIEHLDATELASAVAGGRFEPTADADRLADADAILICVPTPLDADRRPDLGAVEGTARVLAPRLRAGQLVVLESTTYPGTTEEILRPLLEAGGLRAGVEFFLAYSPEREDPGNPRFATASIPKVVGGVGDTATDLAEALYAQVVVSTVRVSSAAAAEATKLLENIFRAVNIALVNELKLIYDRMGLNIWEILDAASTKPFGFMRFDPGPGWGGHCIPVDPFYLSWKARQFGVDSRFIELAGEINVGMARHVVDKLEAALGERGRPLADARVLLLGLAYKKDVADPRESPAFEILAQLLERDARVAYHDPWIAATPAMRSWESLPRLESAELTAELLAAQDAVLLVTDHSAVDYDFVLENARFVVDTRGVYRRPHPKVVQA